MTVHFVAACPNLLCSIFLPPAGFSQPPASAHLQAQKQNQVFYYYEQILRPASIFFLKVKFVLFTGMKVPFLGWNRRFRPELSKKKFSVKRNMSLYDLSIGRVNAGNRPFLDWSVKISLYFLQGIL